MRRYAVPERCARRIGSTLRLVELAARVLLHRLYPQNARVSTNEVVSHCEMVRTYLNARFTAFAPVIMLLWAELGCNARRADPFSASQLIIGRTTAVTVTQLQSEAARFGAAQPIEARELCRLPGAAVHLILVRGEEQPHKHVDHDLVVVLLRGKGVMRLAQHTHRVRAGDVVVIERGTEHAFSNRARDGSLAVVVRIPPPPPAARSSER